MTVTLEIVTPPTVEPVTLAEAKARLRITEAGDDVQISGHITAAREFCERVSRRSLAAKTLKASYSRFPCVGSPISIPAPPLVSASGITYLDSTLTLQTWDPSEYFVATNQTPGLIIPRPGYVYPCPAPVPGAVEVTFVTGAELKQDYKRSILDVVVFIYDHPGEAVPADLVQIPKVWVF